MNKNIESVVVIFDVIGVAFSIYDIFLYRTRVYLEGRRGSSPWY